MTTFVDMTQEQRNQIQCILNDMKTHTMFKRSDAELIRDESLTKWTYHLVKKIYEEDYLKGLTVKECADKQGVNRSRMSWWFKRYGFDASKYSTRKFVPTKKHHDTLILSYTQWNKKYGHQSKSLYYKTKNNISKYLQDQNL